MRHHIIKITADRWLDKDLVQRIKSQARQHAGANPGMQVTVKREITTAPPSLYRPSGRGRSRCSNCFRAFHTHKLRIIGQTTRTEIISMREYNCPDRSYWEVVWTFINCSKQVKEWT